MRRIYHHWEDLECISSGMYNTEPPNGGNAETAKAAYCAFLADIPLFEKHMDKVMQEWPKSCEHFLTNAEINRIAWMGQSAMCHYSGVPCFFRAGFCLLSQEQQTAANKAAKNKIQLWMQARKDFESIALEPLREPVPNDMKGRINHYIRYWEQRGYPNGIPDEVPIGVDREGIAPSYKNISLTILKNDVNCLGLGYSAPKYSLYDMFFGSKGSYCIQDKNQLEFNI